MHTFTLLVLCCNAMQKRERVRVDCKHFQSIDDEGGRAPGQAGGTGLVSVDSAGNRQAGRQADGTRSRTLRSVSP